MAQHISDGALRHALSLELLRFIRDHRPTEAAAIAWAQQNNHVNNFHTLRKGGILRVTDGVVLIAPEYYQEDGRQSRVLFENQVYWLYLDRIDTIRR